jgi:drug/metabolite transporter (DMT)-like permease
VNERIEGCIAAALGGICFGTLGPFSTLFFETGGSAFDLVCVRVVGTAALLGMTTALFRRLELRGIWLIGALALGVPQLGQNFALLEGFARAPAALVILLFYIYPLLVCLGESLFYDVPLTRVRAIAISLGIAGIALTVGRPGSVPMEGVVLGLCAGVCTATYVLAARLLFARHPVEPVELVALMYVLPAVALCAVGSSRFTPPSGEGWLWAILVLAVSSVAAMLLFYTGVKKAGAGDASLLATLEPFVAVVLTYAVLHESLSPSQLVGGSLIVFSVIVVSSLERRRGSSD